MLITMTDENKGESGVEIKISANIEQTAEQTAAKDKTTVDECKHELTVEESKDTNDQVTESRPDDTVEGLSEKDNPETGDEDIDEEDDSEDEEPKLGLLERPIVLESGSKREKKKVQRLESVMVTSPEKSKIIFAEGKGIKLSDCPYIEHQLAKIQTEELKLLHRILFAVRTVKSHLVRPHIRQFNGFAFEKDDKEHNKRIAIMEKYTLPGLRSVCEILGLERGGLKDAIIDRIVGFLYNPTDLGKAIPEPKPKKKSNKKKKTQDKVKKKTPKSKTVKESTADEVRDNEDDLSDSDDKKDDVDLNESQEKIVEKMPKIKTPAKKVEKPKKVDSTSKKPTTPKSKKESPSKKKTPKKSDSEKKKAPPSSIKKSPKVKKAEKRKAPQSDDESSDDEVLQTKKQKTPPNDSELKKCIKKILETADLEQVTMKTVLKQVADLYPDFDLTDRKAYMKTTVRQLIS